MDEIRQQNCLQYLKNFKKPDTKPARRKPIFFWRKQDGWDKESMNTE